MRRLLAAAAGLLFLLGSGASAPSPPNIVVVMTDDLDDQSLQILLGMGMLPHIQRLASAGVRFTNSYTTNAVCAPSRATLLSGLYSHNHHVLNNVPPQGSVLSFSDAATLATSLGAVYWRSYVGKYLNGYGSDPTAAPSSPFNPHYMPPGWDDWHATVDPSTYLPYGYQINVNGTVKQYGSTPVEYQTSVLGDLAAASVAAGQASGKPVFLVFAPRAPHNSINPGVPCPLVGYEVLFCGLPLPDAREQTSNPTAWNALINLFPWPVLKPSFNEADVSDKPPAMQRPLMDTNSYVRWLIQYRLRGLSMLSVDEAVGKLTAALGSQQANTLWVFTSDNGWLNGEHRMSEKMAAYEESARVPLYIVGPAWAPHSVPTLVSNNDLAASILDAAGLPADPGADGRSLVPLLQGTPPPDWRRRLLVEHWAIPELGMLDVPDYLALRTGPADTYPNRLYVEYADGSLELYDATADPYQLTSLQADPAHAAEIAALHMVLEGLKTCGGGTCQALER